MKQLFDMLESWSSITDCKFNDEMKVPVKGWNLPDRFVDIVKTELEDWEGEDLTIEVVKKKEMAYSCARYFEGRDAKDDGFSFYINYHENWKTGRGKVTIYTIKVKRVVSVGQKPEEVSK